MAKAAKKETSPLRASRGARWSVRNGHARPARFARSPSPTSAVPDTATFKPNSTLIEAEDKPRISTRPNGFEDLRVWKRRAMNHWMKEASDRAISTHLLSAPSKPLDSAAPSRFITTNP